MHFRLLKKQWDYCSSPPDRESPFGAAESRLELPHLEQPHRIFVAAGYDTVTEAVAASALVMLVASRAIWQKGDEDLVIIIAYPPADK